MPRRTLPPLLLALVLSLPGPAARAGEGPDPVRAFRAAYDDRDPDARRKAVGLLDGVAGAAATEALLPALADPSARVRERARSVLRGRDASADLAVLADTGLRARPVEVRRRSARRLARAGAAAAPHAAALARALRDRDALVREAAAAALGAAGSADALRPLRRAWRRDRDAAVRGAVLIALARLDPATAGDAARAVLGDGDDGPPTVAALRVLARDGADAALDAAKAVLDHPAWEVRTAAAGVLARVETGRRAALEALVPRLEDEPRRRVRAAVAAALERLAGVPFGEDAVRWRRWLADHAERELPPPPREPPSRTAATGGSKARFWDLPVDSDRAVFVIDTSRSMDDTARLGESATKMQLAVAAFARTLAALDDDTAFNVVAFGTDVEAWAPRATAATRGTRHAALRWLQDRRPAGRTNLFDALALACSDPAVDTVFLLTDGAPSAGEETGRTGFLEGLAWLRRWRPVTVHAVEIGRANTGKRWRGFLASIAAATGGRHLLREKP